MAEPVLQASGLVTRFSTPAGPILPTHKVSLTLHAGQAIGLVGESGSGKSVTARALVRLIEPVGGTLRFDGHDLLALPAAELRGLRARRIAIIVQDPAAALNPVMTVGAQIMRIHRLHTGSTAADARHTALALLRRLRIAEPEARLAAYPHQLSGGMRQRVLIAMALICRPALLIADEPTTALDVTVEAEILALLDELRSEMGLALLLISHDLAVVGRLTDRTAVMYAGSIVEEGPTAALLGDPRHPYTHALLGAVPRGRKADGTLPAIPGEPPDLARLPQGCPFRPRCPLAAEPCGQPQTLREAGVDRVAACWRATA